MIDVRPFINGAFVDPTSDGLVTVVTPSTGTRLMDIPEGSVIDVDRAVASARATLERNSWRAAPASFKKKTLHRWADLLGKHAFECDSLDAGEMGKPISEPRGNATTAAELLRFYAEAVDKVLGEVYESDTNSFVAQRLVPRGVVAAVVPWNFPTFNAVLKVAPALAAGNTVVLKPSELASRSALRIAQLAVEAGLPSGALNVVPGVGRIVGRALGLHSDVAMIAFTGSTEVGKQMLQYAGRSNMKVVVAECGGKSPHIVFDDGVNLDAAAEVIAQGLLTNQGQVCSVGSRVLVHRAIEELLIERVVARMKQVVIGDSLDPKTTFGPLASADQFASVMRHVESGHIDGAELVLGGQPTLPESGGYFFEPTVFRKVASSAQIAQKEIFGPVLSVMSFESDTDAIRIANGTIYGLAAYVWTSRLSTAFQIAKAISSSVIINAVAPVGEGAGHAWSNEPAGESGVGTEGGLAGMQSYLRRQLIWVNYA